MPPFWIFLQRFVSVLSPCGAVSDIARGRRSERHHGPAADPVSTKYRNRSYDQSWTMALRPTNARANISLPTWDNGSEADKRGNIFPHHHQTTLDTTDVPVGISSFGNGTPKTGKPTHRQKKQSLYSLGSRLAPCPAALQKEPFVLGLGISHRIHQLPTSFPFPTRQTLPRPPLQRDRFPRSTSVPPPFIAAEAHLPIPLALPHLIVLPKSHRDLVSAHLRQPRPTACTLPTTRDPTEPLCSGAAFPAEVTAW